MLLKKIWYSSNSSETQSKNVKEIQDRILPLKSLYYFKFLGVLAQYVEYIKEGYAYIPTIIDYAYSLQNVSTEPRH